jgi:hypothetical protein
LYNSGDIELLDNTLADDLQVIHDNVELLYKGYNQDEIELLDPIAQALLKFQ